MCPLGVMVHLGLSLHADSGRYNSLVIGLALCGRAVFTSVTAMRDHT